MIGSDRSINDVKNLKEWLVSTWKFPTDAEHMRILTDEKGASPDKMPTRKNMIEAFKWLVAGAKPGDSLFLHYSGHVRRLDRRYFDIFVVAARLETHVQPRVVRNAMNRRILMRSMARTRRCVRLITQRRASSSTTTCTTCSSRICPKGHV